MINMYNVNDIIDNNQNFFDYYKIKKGDTLYQISKNYNVNPELLAILNGLNMNDYIYPNQEILVPKDGYSYYLTKEGDTLVSVASTFKSNVNDIIRFNQNIFLEAGQLLVNKIS